MSRGLSKTQRAIVAILDGSDPLKCFAKTSKPVLLTAELVEELMQRKLVRASRPRKQQLATVLRSCRGLFARGLITGKYSRDFDSGPQLTVAWSVRRSGKKENDQWQA